MAKSRQLRLPSVTSDEQSLELELKPFIQPFERLLARAELAGLLPELSTVDPFGELAPARLNLQTTVSADRLRRRLAYWQRIGVGELAPTDQVLFELSDGMASHVNLATAQAASLPRKRKLRYGPHDIHEYRGKFFPQLVRSLVNSSGLDEGGVVIDPTCGSGTTNCEARLLGMETLGLDLNPLSRLVARTKTALLDTDPEELRAEAIRFVAALPEQADMATPYRWDGDDVSYLLRWFDPIALAELNTILSHIDSVENPIFQDLFRVALSNIVRGVSWQKETDLRVRKEITPHVAGAGIGLFISEMDRQVAKLLPYLSLVRQLHAEAFPAFQIVQGNATGLTRHFEPYMGRCDVLLTSPPYATALPYIDTDRLSLIVLGLLPRREHRGVEFDMIGTREVQEKQRGQLWDLFNTRRSELPDAVSGFIDDLASVYHTDKVGFRRRNLPALLGKYFLDMTDSMREGHRMMRPGGYGFYVVGNNSTKGEGSRLEIPTDRFLWEIGRKVGWSQVRIVDMELLPSRDIFRANRGTAEKILVFASTLRRQAVYSELRNASDGRERNSEWDFHNVDTQEHLHSIHPYPARFIPQIPRKAILDYSLPGQIVLDPFCGSGTTLLESSLLGRPSIGVDNNAVAILVAMSKVAQYTPADLQVLRAFAAAAHAFHLARPEDAWVPEYESLDYWFDPVAIGDLSKVRGAIRQLTGQAQTLALAAFSAVLVRASYQDSDTRYARIDRPYEPGMAFRAYRTKLLDAINGIEQIIDQPHAEARVVQADSRQLDFIADESIDFLVTSPPYLNAYDYHKYHRQRLHWIEGDVAMARDQEIGKHDTFTRPGAQPEPYFDDMRRCFAEWYRVLRPGSRALVVIGDAIVSGQPVPVADRFTGAMMSLGFQFENNWLRNLLRTNKSFNQNARIDQEHVLLYRKPA